jgi:hypothetical protein
MYKLRALLVAGLFALLLQSCSLTPQAEEVPSFINVNSITFDDTTATFRNIAVMPYAVNYAWVFHDGVFLGVFQIPAKLPVLAEGQGSLRLWGGVKLMAMNGLSHLYAVHPLYRDYVTPIALVRGQEADVDATITYAAETPATFTLNENFENSSKQLHLANGQAMPVTEVTTSQGITKAGYITQAQTIVSDTLVLPRDRRLLVLEFDYKSASPLALEFKADILRAGTIYKGLTLDATDTWQKVFVNLTSEVNNAVPDSRHLLFFNYAPGTAGDSLLLDNVRIVHRR